MDPDLERQVMEDVIRTLDRHENENLPQVKLGQTEVNSSESIVVKLFREMSDRTVWSITS